jgi:hypothetical protein
MASLSESALLTLLLKKDEYYVGDQPSGNLVLQVIICESSQEKNANTSIIRTKLSKLDQCAKVASKSSMNTYNCNCTCSMPEVKLPTTYLFAAYKEEEVKYETGEQMMARLLMERRHLNHTSSHSVAIKAYHAYNGIFHAHKWVGCCRMAKQGLTFAGVNSHHEMELLKEGSRNCRIWEEQC